MCNGSLTVLGEEGCFKKNWEDRGRANVPYLSEKKHPYISHDVEKRVGKRWDLVTAKPLFRSGEKKIISQKKNGTGRPYSLSYGQKLRTTCRPTGRKG